VRLLTILISLCLIFLISCISMAPREEVEVKNVDTKVIEEFHEHVRNGDFYGAGGSFIEYLNCCGDGKEEEFRGDLTGLYEDKIEGFTRENDGLSSIEYTFSYINLMRGGLEGEDLAELGRKLDGYIIDYIDTNLEGMGGLRNASWLIYFSRLSGSPQIRRKLTEFFISRGNGVLASRYLDDDSEELREQVLRITAESKGRDRGELIESIIKSSVKIMVDRGIKTEGGVGLPDQAIGTGIVIDSEGYIITNYHIIESSVDPAYEGYSRIYVIPGKDDSVRFVARVVGYDQVFDLALLKIEKQMETYIKVGDSERLKQGQSVVAIGNPAGLTNTVTSGVVSSVERPFFQIGDIIQIDAALNPGNSGGALIDEQGFLVGIAFAGLENFENLNFAIPSLHMLSIMNRLFEGGEVARSWIGCSLSEEGGDLIVEYIVPEGPARVVGLEKGDIIREVNGIHPGTSFDVQNALSYLSAGMIGTIVIEREGNEIEKKVYVTERPVYPSLSIYERDAYENIITPLFGMVLTQIEGAKKKDYVVARTLYNSIASGAGIAEGDTIRLKEIEYEKEGGYFYLVLDLKSKRFGYLNKSMVLYRYVEVNTFI